VNAEFNWWLLIVGLVLGAALTWLVMAELARRDADVTESEQRGEALWIASMLSARGRTADGASVEEILSLHRQYLAAPPPDEPEWPSEPPLDTATLWAVDATPLIAPNGALDGDIDSPAGHEAPEPGASADAEPSSPAQGPITRA
jgi:hypothetical protein